ncbi:MAG: hypothetical protein AAGI07_04760 [Bacteroidota bacterium]
MLLILESVIGALASIALLISILTGFRFMKKSIFISQGLHDRQETEPDVVTRESPLMITRHFYVLEDRKLQLSDLEARAQIGVGIITAVLFGTLFVHLGT